MNKIPDECFTKSNPYGYKLNINHPLIREHYERFKVKCGTTILSDEQRHEFESYMIPYLEKKARSDTGAD
jgi:hypothetical protein